MDDEVAEGGEDRPVELEVHAVVGDEAQIREGAEGLRVQVGGRGPAPGHQLDVVSHPAADRVRKKTRIGTLYTS